MAMPRDFVATAGKAAGVSLAALALMAQAAGAVTIKMGSDTGNLVFEPSSVTIKAGDSVTWKNNAGFPHNVMFDEDEIPVRAHSLVQQAGPAAGGYTECTGVWSAQRSELTASLLQWEATLECRNRGKHWRTP